MTEPMALMGGTFDPVHFGHLIVARAIAEYQGYRRVILVPAAVPPHKHPAQCAAADRLAMLNLAVAGDDLFDVSTAEIGPGGPSYTIDTIEQLRAAHGQEVPPHWIIGADMLAMLPKWHRVEELLEKVQLVVAHRPPWPAGLEEILARLETQLPPGRVADIRRHLVPAPLIDISSTDIRRRVRQGLAIRYLVPDAVEKYILSRGLYR